jgi:poly-gamma-glutamate synthesis protein (capsule biosynthesis protein)
MKTRYMWSLFCAALFASCTAPPRIDYLTITGGDEFPREYDFLASLFGKAEFLEPLGFRWSPALSGEEAGTARRDSGKKERPPEGPEIFIDFAASWAFEETDGGLPISKTWYVPREDALAGRGTAELAACLDGRETLIPLNALEAPFIALRVGDTTVEEPEYPLVKTVELRIRARKPSPDTGGTPGRTRAGRKIEKAHAEALVKIQALEDALRAAEKPLIEEPPGILWIAAGGDVMLDRGAAEILFEEGPRGIFGGTADFLARADLALVNLEGAVSSRGTKVKKSFNFRFDPSVAAALRDAGIDGVLQANNHAFDYGEEAFLDTLTHLAAADIAALGAGLNDDEASRPFFFQKGAHQVRTFGIASFPRERNGWDGLSAAAEAEKAGLLHARRGGGEKLKKHISPDAGTSPGTEPLDIVLFHGGIEWDTRPDTFTRDFYTGLIRHGADLVIGSHPHVVQGFEWVLGKPVFWSLGNYIFGGMENTGGGEQGLFIRLGFSGRRFVYLEPFPLTLSHTRTTIAPAAELNRFYARSRELREAGSEKGE